MRIAALYDIHGNLPALDAVLREVRGAGADGIVVGGDVLPGPMPRETLQRLFACGLPVQFIYGNGEVAVLDRMAGRDSPKVPAPYQPLIEWTAEQVRDYQQTLAAWPMTLRLEAEGLGTVLFCHATPRNEDDIFTRVTPEERLRRVFDAAEAQVVVCGHTHLQFDRMIGPTRVVNAGSVGMPFGSPDAAWLLLDPGLELRRTSYDVQRAIDLMRERAAARAPKTCSSGTCGSRHRRRRCSRCMPLPTWRKGLAASHRGCSGPQSQPEAGPDQAGKLLLVVETDLQARPHFTTPFSSTLPHQVPAPVRHEGKIARRRRAAARVARRDLTRATSVAAVRRRRARPASSRRPASRPAVNAVRMHPMRMPPGLHEP